MPYKAAPIVLDEETRSELERRTRAGTTPQRDVKRARVILLANSGMSSARIAKEVDMHEENVAIWRRRFLERGLEGLADLARPGRPLIYGHDERVKLASLACSARDPDDPVQYWTHEALAEAMREDGTPISASQVGRILAAMDIKPHRVLGWLNRKQDPEFWDRVQEVCGLYLSPPDNALVVSVDEKTGIQAKERLVTTSAAAPGRPARREFEYRRHGTASLMAALEVHTGQVLATDIARNDSITFIDFLNDIDCTVPTGLDIHLIMDNGSSHRSKQTKAWLAEHPRFVAHYTPVHASWLNQVELLFSIITRKVIRRGDFSSRDDLVSKLMRFIASYNEVARPFAWTYAGKPLTVA